MSKYTHIVGTDFISQETIRDQNGTVVDITGATVVFTIIDRTGTQIDQATVTSHDSPLSGLTTIAFTDGETSTWPVGYFETLLRVTLSSGLIYAEKGDIKVVGNIE